jgi:GT2 family glycosyltransferase
MGPVVKRVSVVLSTFETQRLDYVSTCLLSIRKQTLQPDEIILSLDPDQSLFNFYRSHLPDDIRIVMSDSRGLSSARNAGVGSADGEIIAFIDDDAIADGRWLENLIQNYEDQNVIGAGGLIKPMWEKSRPFWFPEELDWIVGCTYKGLSEQRSFVRNITGCNMSFRKQALEAAGPFRSDLGRLGRKILAGEETDICIRILAAIPGSKIVYDPSSIVYHTVPKRRASLRYVLERSFYEGLSKASIAWLSPVEGLSTEKGYLLYLMKEALPQRLRGFYRLQNLSQAAVMVSSTLAVFAGYVVASLNRPTSRLFRNDSIREAENKSSTSPLE